MMKNNNKKKIPKKYMYTYSSILYSKLATLTCDVTCSKLQRDGENILVPFCQTNTLKYSLPWLQDIEPGMGQPG